MKRTAGKADPVAEVYKTVSRQSFVPKRPCSARNFYCMRAESEGRECKHTAGLPPPEVVEAYKTDTSRAKFESLACFKKSVAEMPDETPTTQARLGAAREAMLSKFCTSDNDSEYERIHARPVTEAHHAAEEMRLPTTSARQDGGKLPPAMVCSARLP